METTENVLQRILDEQGYIILCTKIPDCWVGMVINGFHVTGRSKTDSQVVVVGLATRDEALSQAKRFLPGAGPLDDYGAVAFVKVVAE